MAKFRKKPVVVEAIRYRGDNSAEVEACAKSLELAWPCGWVFDEIGITIPTLEGNMLAKGGDYIIRGVKGEFYPCKPDIFAATYEAEPLEPATETGDVR
jgi:hypothetical protein